MNGKRLSMLLLLVVMLLLATPRHTQAAGYGNCYYLNGYVMYPSDVGQFSFRFGALPCGSYWLNEQGNVWLDGAGYIGNISYPLGNSNQSAWPPHDIDRGIGGNWGTDGECYYFSWSDGTDYMPPGC